MKTTFKLLAILFTLFAFVAFSDDDVDGAFAIPLGIDNGWYHYNPMNNVITPTGPN